VTAATAPDQRLDLRGVRCPANSARALVRLEGMEPGQTLEILLDDGEPIASVPESLAADGHAVVSRVRQGTAWYLLVKAGG